MRLPRAARESRHRHRRADRDHPGAGFPDRRDHLRPGRRAAKATAPAAAAWSCARAPTSRTSRRAAARRSSSTSSPTRSTRRTCSMRIGELVREKKLEGISDLRDESDKSGMRVVIELKRGEVPEVVLNNLYKQTQLQDSFGMNMVALVDGQPRLLNLKQLLDALPRATAAKSSTRRTRVRTAQGARARPCARRPGGRAVQRRRDHRADQGRRRRRPKPRPR